VAVPFTDGRKQLQVVANLEDAHTSECRSLVKEFEKSTTLAFIDEAWKEHLREMDELKQSVQNATYEQKDPLLVYKFESFELFKVMLDANNREQLSFLYKGGIPINKSEDVRQAQKQQSTDYSGYKESRAGGAPERRQNGQQQQEQPKKLEPVRVEKKVGRNEKCPCGSGKKYKQCHGKA